jgi:hypothetical protein
LTPRSRSRSSAQVLVHVVVVVVGVMGPVIACSGGGAGGECHGADTQCPAAQICVADRCVTPGGAVGADGGAAPGVQDGGPSVSPGGGGGKVRCSSDPSHATCACALTADWPDTSLSCGPSDVGSGSSLCCADESGWPSTGGCVCHATACAMTGAGDTCSCSTALVTGPDHAVAQCPSGSAAGWTCCLDHSVGFCTCYQGSTCPADATAVSSCTASSVTCGSRVREQRCK